MNFWTLDNVRHASGARWAMPPGSLRSGSGVGPGLAGGVAIDSRTISPGQVFFAIKGQTHDGHDHALEAARRGAAMIVAERPIQGLGHEVECPLALVASTRRALLALAAVYRASLAAKVIAVCGSNGKTTTVRLIHAALTSHGPGQAHQAIRVTSSVKSFNNEIGVPLTILSARPDDAALICEVGSNAPGEIAALGCVVKPDVAVITSIGREHLAGFVDLEGVAREEASILKHLRPGGLAILPADAPLLRPFASCATRVVWFGIAPRDQHPPQLRAEAIAQRLVEPSGGGALAPRLSFVAHLPGAGAIDVTMPLAGAHNAGSALVALAVASELGVSASRAAQGLAGASGPEMRLAISTIGRTITLVNDAYNANPESTLAAIATARALAGHRRLILVLGDMLELGDSEASAHAEVLAAAIGGDPVRSTVITVGPRYAAAVSVHQPPPAVAHSEAIAALDEGAARSLEGRVVELAGQDPCVVLVKGSRGVRLDRLCMALDRNFADARKETTPA
jgi:UDP-N-acetylmuramoyl-tripeptide--D-alanyl-D-alanine ligase